MSTTKLEMTEVLIGVRVYTTCSTLSTSNSIALSSGYCVSTPPWEYMEGLHKCICDKDRCKSVYILSIVGIGVAAVHYVIATHKDKKLYIRDIVYDNKGEGHTTEYSDQLEPYTFRFDVPPARLRVNYKSVIRDVVLVLESIASGHLWNVGMAANELPIELYVDAVYEWVTHGVMSHPDRFRHKPPQALVTMGVIPKSLSDGINHVLSEGGLNNALDKLSTDTDRQTRL